MAGWHRVFYDEQLLPLLRGEKIEKPKGKSLMLDDQSKLAKSLPEAVTKGTSNFRWMAAAGWYLWAIREGEPADVEASRARVLELYARERKIGHQMLEQTCPDPHRQLHDIAHCGIRIAAKEAGEKKVLTENDAWWRGRIALDRAGATPDGEVILPGCRGDGGPATQVGTAIYREVMGLKHLGPAKNKKWWQDPVYGGGAPSAVLKLLAGKDDLGGAADPDTPLPRLRLPMTVERRPNGHLIQLKGKAEKEPVIDWVMVLYKQPGKHTVTFGKSWQTPAPQLP